MVDAYDDQAEIIKSRGKEKFLSWYRYILKEFKKDPQGNAHVLTVCEVVKHDTGWNIPSDEFASIMG